MAFPYKVYFVFLLRNWNHLFKLRPIIDFLPFCLKISVEWRTLTLGNGLIKNKYKKYQVHFTIIYGIVSYIGQKVSPLLEVCRQRFHLTDPKFYIEKT